MDEFTVVEGHGRALLGKDTAEKLNVLRVGPLSSPQSYSSIYIYRGPKHEFLFFEK